MDWEETLERVRAAAHSCAAAELSRLRIEDRELAIDMVRSARAQRAAPAPAPALEAGPPNGKPHNTGMSSGDVRRTVLRAEFVGILRFTRPMVVPGTVLTEDREVAFVEALGIRNPIRSGGPGRVVEVFVGDGEPVDFGRKLFALEP